MRLPQSLAESRYFSFNTFFELLRATAGVGESEEIEMKNLDQIGLPPITSVHVLATMFGLNPGIIGAFTVKPSRYYRTFYIPKGRSVRRIDAPRVGLKIIQKWLSIQLQKFYIPLPHVYGFVSDRSHVGAASVHVGSVWAFSIDIRNFFPSTSIDVVAFALAECGFSSRGASLLAQLTCLNGNLAQGAPSSPVLSNICFAKIDVELEAYAIKHNLRLTRYADDVVFSGVSNAPESLRADIESIFCHSYWKIASEKTEMQVFPQRLKVHGLLVQQKLSLTKGYRNRLRAYKHLLNNRPLTLEDSAVMKGHIAYEKHVLEIGKKVDWTRLSNLG